MCAGGMVRGWIANEIASGSREGRNFGARFRETDGYRLGIVAWQCSL